jgi:hypothetical protein
MSRCDVKQRLRVPWQKCFEVRGGEGERQVLA